MNNLLMTGPAPQGPQGPAPQAAAQPPQVSPEQLAAARAHMGVMMKSLLALAQKPKGSLSKRDLFDAAGEMIAEGAFSTPESRQQLVAELAQIPDDEASVRQAVGAQLMKLAQAQDAIHQHFGPGEG